MLSFYATGRASIGQRERPRACRCHQPHDGDEPAIFRHVAICCHVPAHFADADALFVADATGATTGPLRLRAPMAPSDAEALAATYSMRRYRDRRTCAPGRDDGRQRQPPRTRATFPPQFRTTHSRRPRRAASPRLAGIGLENEKRIGRRRDGRLPTITCCATLIFD